MDHQAVEKAHGITVSAAAERLEWGDVIVNLVDTPGHVDFTLEVERSLRVLDGAVLVVCGVAGVQPQTRSVVRQMQRHRVPFLAFINKMDRAGADARRVVGELRTRFDTPAALLTLPLGKEGTIEGVLDVLTGDALVFVGDHGREVVRTPLPAGNEGRLNEARAELLEQLGESDERVLQAWLEGAPFDAALVGEAIRSSTLARQFIPVLVGSAYRNVGVQPLLDAVAAYLPDPEEREHALPKELSDGLIAFVFHVEPNRHGTIAHVRLYRGSIARGDTVITADGTRIRVGRLVRSRAAAIEEIEVATAGDIVALFGANVQLGETLSARGDVRLPTLTIPEPVLGLAVAPIHRSDQERLVVALHRFVVRDPSLRLQPDPVSGELVLLGLGELHLSITLERIQAEYGIETTVGPPRIAYRETISRAVTFDWLHRKQDGGQGQYARVVGRIEPTEAPFVFDDRVRGGAIAKDYLGACASGFAEGCARGPLTGSPVTGVRVVLEDGHMHAEDSSDLAFRVAARDALRDAVKRAEPVVLEPIMSVEVRAPQHAFGGVLGLLVQRRGVITGNETHGVEIAVTARVPLVEMFGFVTALRSETAGEGTFAMEPMGYAPLARREPKTARS